ncbi:hypothetical protein QS306_09850 [Paraburkholderia bonniea]|uniref:hypothetical protein n=1 Tax=Paraburkholderia bonniea TaxID=2152891 RepID=UPI002572F05F|nr:hypothetical protein [Paraburkholderia bonniea]WJF89422.1 hypothetical protein QS306_09850 [Paraburkholderia bonniea]WJF92737.1 hypothetical protein QS308_09860 [Paraburkholderia bonniea]
MLRVWFALSVLGMTGLSGVSTMAFASDERTSQTVEVAGERAHFAQEFCGFAPEQVASYRERLKTALTGVDDFDERWQVGWRREEDGAIQMQALRLSDPEDFAARLKGDCRRVKWQADNLLRTHQAK